MKPVLLGMSALVLAQAMLAYDTVAQEVTLKAVSSFTENTTYSRPFERFIERVSQRPHVRPPPRRARDRA